MRVEIVCFGSELLLDKVNTNSVAIAEKLAQLGIAVSQVVTVGDHTQDIERALRESLGRSSVVLTCGGLGPTFDDLTRLCVSKVIRRNLVYSKSIHKKILRRFKSVRLPMPAENKIQAYLISGAKEVDNAFGTAPGQIIHWKGKSLILLPGPARECIPMMDRTILPYLKVKYPVAVSKRLILHVYGYPESKIDEMIMPVVRRNWDRDGVKVIFGILAHRSIVDVKVTAQGNATDRIRKTIFQIKSELMETLGDWVYGENDDTLESVIGKMLSTSQQTLALAESCTGGRVSNKLTDIPGSSVYFKEGVITYSNESKIKLLGVKKKTLQKYGAVSENCASEMARGVKDLAKADWGVSVTGIAGPLGGTREKPVGTVCFGVCSKRGVQTEVKNFFGTRTEIKEKSALFALNLLRLELIRQ